MERSVKCYLSCGFLPQISSPCVSSLIPSCQMQLGTYPTARKEPRATKSRCEGLLGFPTLACHHRPPLPHCPVRRTEQTERGYASQYSPPDLPKTSLCNLAVVRMPFNIYTEIVLRSSNAFYDYTPLTFSH